MCHESFSFDAQSGNTIDLKVMIHKIHSGETLPSVKAGGFYGIFGFGNTFNDFSDIVYPQDKRNCQTCHQESDTDTPQASNWRKTVNAEVCGSCHDNVSWTLARTTVASPRPASSALPVTARARRSRAATCVRRWR